MKRFIGPFLVAMSLVLSLFSLAACGDKLGQVDEEESAAAEAGYTVIFQDWDGTILKIVSHVKEGSDVEPPEDPVRKGYEFVGWDKSCEGITSDLAVKACYKSTKVYRDLYGIGSSLDEAAQKLTLTFSFSQSALDPAPILSFQLRINYDPSYTVLSATEGEDVTYYNHEEDAYITVVYFDYSGEGISDSFDFLTVEFDISGCTAGDAVSVEARYILDLEGNDIADRVELDAEYVLS